MSFNDINLSNERKIISYLLNNVSELSIIDVKYLLNEQCNAIYKAIHQSLQETPYPTLDQIHTNVRNFDSSIEFQFVQELCDEYRQDIDLTWLIDNLKQNYLKNHINVNLLNELIAHTNDAGELDFDDVDNFADKLKENIAELRGGKYFQTAKDRVDRYKETLQQRKDGIIERTLGYKVLKERAIRIGEAGEMTLLFGPSGMGKSAVAQNIELSEVSKGTPVFKIGTEMSADSEMDRSLAMRTGVPAKELYKKDIDESLDKKLQRSLSGFARYNNYVYTDESALSISEVDVLVKKAKDHFKKEEVFKNNDDYLLVIIDLASMLKEVAGEYGEGIEKGSNLLHQIAKKHDCHLLLVVQANENKMRSGMRFKKPEEIDHYVLTEEDIKGGAGWKERCRMVLCTTRPLLIKKKYFPDRMDEWELEEDILYINCIKNNNGPIFRIPFIFDEETFRIYPKKD